MTRWLAKLVALCGGLFKLDLTGIRASSTPLLDPLLQFTLESKKEWLSVVQSMLVSMTTRAVEQCMELEELDLWLTWCFDPPLVHFTRRLIFGEVQLCVKLEKLEPGNLHEYGMNCFVKSGGPSQLSGYRFKMCRIVIKS